MSRRSAKKKAVPKRQSESSADLLRRVKAKKQRRTILSVSLVLITLTVVIVVAVVLNPPGTLPGTLVVHIYDSAVYQPPSCPSPVSTLARNVTVTLNGPRSTTTPQVVGLIAYSQAPVGTYQVSATAAGYAADSENVTVTSGNTVHVCLALTKT